MASNQKIGIFPLTSLVTGSLVGSGIFLLPSTLAPYGTISIAGWIMTAIGAIILALIFAELASKMPKNGGPYVYARKAFGNDVGFFVCWGYWTLSWISNSALVIGAMSYITSITGPMDKSTYLMIELAILFSITSFNLLGIKITGGGELFLTVLKVLPLIILPVLGLAFINADNFYPIVRSENTDLPAIFNTINAVAFLTLWGFVGLETGTVPAGQVENPSKTIPRAVIFGTLIAAFVYILGNSVMIGVIPHEQLIASKAPYADLASAIFGGSWGTVIAIAAIITCIGTLHGWILIVGRIPLGAASEGLFPKIFSRTTKEGTPYMSMLISSALTTPFIVMSLSDNLTQQFNSIIEVSVTFILLIYAVCACAFLKIFAQSGELTTKRLIIGSLGLAFTLWALWASSFQMVLMSLSLLVLGLPLNIWMKRKK